MKKIIYLFCCILLNYTIIAQDTNVVAGPMVSYIDGYSTQMWFLLEKDALKIEVNIRDYDEDKLLEYDFDVTNKDAFDNYIPFTVSLDKLLPNTEYIASIYVDGVFIKELDLFTKRSHLDDTQFILGYNISEESSSSIFTHMRRTNSDFMIWLGGHVKFDENINYDRMINNYINIRKKKELNKFMYSVPQIASWNDLDYGPSGSGSNWALKDSAYLAFTHFWPNALHKTYNYTYYDYGLYQRYSYNDVDVFLLDSRTFKENPSDKATLYGDKQIERLFQEINNNGATFTVIASPSPFTFDSEDSFLNYQKQFEYFMYRLRISGTEGVILVSTGASDNTQMYEYDLSETKWNDKVTPFYPLYEFNFAPLSSDMFSLIRVEGAAEKRILSFDSYNSEGSLVYRKRIHESELKN
jgi:hypothetical protein